MRLNRGVTGRRTFNSLFDEPTIAGVDAAVDTIRKKGRNSQKNEQKNECLLARSYYYRNFKGFDYLEVKNILAREFFLETSTIDNIVLGNTHIISEMRRNGVQVSELRSRWPQYSW